MKLYGYWRSTAAFRVRIALHLKNINFETVSVHLVKNGGEQHQLEYSRLNPAHLVPTLVDDDFALNQSLAIIDYLDAVNEHSPLYPNDPQQRAQVQALVLDIACEIHPINNLRVQQYLANELSLDSAAKSAWIDHWMRLGFTAIETKLTHTAGTFCFGEQVTVADICLVAQVYNAHRFKVSMAQFPLIEKIVQHCNQLTAFIKASPENQPDAV